MVGLYAKRGLVRQYILQAQECAEVHYVGWKYKWNGSCMHDIFDVANERYAEV